MWVACFPSKYGCHPEKYQNWSPKRCRKITSNLPLSQACFRGELLRAQLRRSPEAAGGRKSIGVGKIPWGGSTIFFENLLWKITQVSMFFIGKPSNKAASFNSYVKLSKGSQGQVAKIEVSNQKASCGVSWRFKQPKLHVTGPSLYILLGMEGRFWYLGTALGSSKLERWFSSSADRIESQRQDDVSAMFLIYLRTDIDGTV